MTNRTKGVNTIKKYIKILKNISVFMFTLLVIGLFFPTWTPRIVGEDSINELNEVEINGTKLAVMIRGYQRDNPVVIVVHGGPCCSEIPYIRKYQENLEKNFTIVHYDQRGSGKSYHFFQDYSELSPTLLVQDLIELSRNISKQFNNKSIILMGHSFGTYLSMQAIMQAPELYQAYIGIGQVSDPIIGEIDNLNYCIEQAQSQNETSDIVYLEGLRKSVEKGQIITPRNYVRKYGGAARLINETNDMITGMLLNPEYNLLDTIRYYLGVIRFQDILMKKKSDEEITQQIQGVNIPIYFVMGNYDHMTSTKSAKEYFDVLSAPEKSFIIYEQSAHYPQLEQHEKFYNWMCETFTK